MHSNNATHKKQPSLFSRKAKVLMLDIIPQAALGSAVGTGLGITALMGLRKLPEPTKVKLRQARLAMLPLGALAIGAMAARRDKEILRKYREA